MLRGVLSRALVALGLACMRRPGVAFGLALAICGGLTALGLTAPVDLSFTGVISQEEPLIARYFEVGRALKFSGRLLVLAEGDEETLDEASAALAPAIEGLEEVARVSQAPDEDWWRARAVAGRRRDLRRLGGCGGRSRGRGGGRGARRSSGRRGGAG